MTRDNGVKKTCPKTCASGSGAITRPYQISGYQKVVTGGQDLAARVKAMEEDLLVGPITTGYYVYADFHTFWSEGGGNVYKPSASRGSVLEKHAVEIVGHGTSPTQGDYWIVKNSWGANPSPVLGYWHHTKGVDACSIESEWSALSQPLQRRLQETEAESSGVAYGGWAELPTHMEEVQEIGGFIAKHAVRSMCANSVQTENDPEPNSETANNATAFTHTVTTARRQIVAGELYEVEIELHTDQTDLAKQCTGSNATNVLWSSTSVQKHTARVWVDTQGQMRVLSNTRHPAAKTGNSFFVISGVAVAAFALLAVVYVGRGPASEQKAKTEDSRTYEKLPSAQKEGLDSHLLDSDDTTSEDEML
jgi:hypothetical protein